MKQIKSFFVSFFKSPVLIVFALICIFMLPSSINTMSVAFRSAIAVAVGIDKNEDDLIELQVAINISSATDSLAENSNVITSTGITVGEAFANLNLMFGRSVKLGHTRFVMIGKNLSRENVTETLDRLVRTSKLRNTVQLVYCPDKISDMFNIGIQLKSQTGIKLSDIVCYTQSNSTTSIRSNIDSFYKGYMCPSEISKINTVSISDDYTQGISTTPDTGGDSSGATTGGEAGDGGGESSEGGTSGAEADTKNQYISNRGELAIYESGILKTVLNHELSNGVNWLSTDYNPKDLTVKIENSSRIENGIVTFDILSKKVDIESFFHRGIPFVSAKIVLSLDIDEIISSEEKHQINSNVIDETIKSQIGRTIRSQIADALMESKRLKLDIFELNNIFYKNNSRDYDNFLKNNSKQELIEKTQISAEIEVKII